MSELTTYFKEARTWATDTFGQLENSKRRYQLAFFAAMGVNITASLVILMLAHTQTLVPLLIHHYDNGITTIDAPASHPAIPAERAQVESDIVRYIQHREAYDSSSYRTQYELVHLLSN